MIAVTNAFMGRKRSKEQQVFTKQRDKWLAEQRKIHELWSLNQRDERQFRKLDPMVNYRIDSTRIPVAVADFLPEKGVGQHIRTSIEEVLRHRIKLGLGAELLGGGGTVRGDIRGEGMAEQLFQELREKVTPSVPLEYISCVVCWGSVQPLMGRVTPHFSVYNFGGTNATLEIDLSQITFDSRLQNKSKSHDHQYVEISQKVGPEMQMQLWKAVQLTADITTIVSAMRQVTIARYPRIAQFCRHLPEKERTHILKHFDSFYEMRIANEPVTEKKELLDTHRLALHEDLAIKPSLPRLRGYEAKSKRIKLALATKQSESVLSFCTQCGTILSPGLQFCTNCGVKLTVTLKQLENASDFCTQCGVKLSSGLRFCTNCGKEIS